MIQLHLQNVQINVQEQAPGSPVSKILTFLDPQSGIAVVVPMPEHSCAAIGNALLNKKAIEIPGHPIPESVLRNGGISK